MPWNSAAPRHIDHIFTNADLLPAGAVTTEAGEHDRVDYSYINDINGGAACSSNPADYLSTPGGGTADYDHRWITTTAHPRCRKAPDTDASAVFDYCNSLYESATEASAFSEIPACQSRFYSDHAFVWGLVAKPGT